MDREAWRATVPGVTKELDTMTRTKGQVGTEMWPSLSWTRYEVMGTPPHYPGESTPYLHKDVLWARSSLILIK